MSSWFQLDLSYFQLTVINVIWYYTRIKKKSKQSFWFFLAGYSYGDTKLGQGRENVKAFLKENPKVAAEIEEVIRNSI